MDASTLNMFTGRPTLDRDTLRRRWASVNMLSGQDVNMFCSDLPVFLNGEDLSAIRRVVSAIEAVAELPALMPQGVAELPDRGARGAFFGFDFHLGSGLPQLIEVNTNAGGGMIAASIAGSQLPQSLPNGWVVRGAEAEAAFVEMLEREFRLEQGGELKTVAIVDHDPRNQFLFPEFLYFVAVLERRGIRTRIVDPDELQIHADGLYAGDLRIDLVYNRLTDFDFSDPRHVSLNRAWHQGLVVITPHPRAHATRADKSRLVAWSDLESLREAGAPDDAIEVLMAHLPRTVLVTPDNADMLWSDRDRWFFKPCNGFASRATYRGDKVTRGRFEQVRNGNYVAQQVVPPGTRAVRVEGKEMALKYDVRAYVYDGDIQLLSARLYQGQTTNLRTPGGGFAAVVFADHSLDSCRLLGDHPPEAVPNLPRDLAVEQANYSRC